MMHGQKNIKSHGEVRNRR